MKSQEQNTLFVNGHINYTKVFTNEDGEKVKLVARPYGFLIAEQNPEIGVDVYKLVDNNWQLCKSVADRKEDQTWVSREHYIKTQRKDQVSEALRVATAGKFFKIVNEFKKLLFAKPALVSKIEDDFNTHQFENIHFKFENMNA